MRLLRKWPFTLLMAALFLCAIGCWTFGRHGMWLSSGICLALFSGMAAYLYNQQNRQLKRWHTFIHGKHNLPPKERLLPDNASARTMNDIKQELEQLTDSYHHRLLNEAIRQKYYETLLNHVETGVMTCTPTGEIQWMNHAARQQFGTHPRVPAAWLKLPAGDTQVTTVERHGMTKDYLLSASRLVTDGQPQRLFTLRNIQQVLDRQQTEAWKTLARVLTHEIMNSLSPILSLTETLASTASQLPDDSPGQDRMRQALQTIHRRSKGLLDFVNNYRRLTRLPAPTYTDIRADELFNDMKRLFNDPHITFDQPYPEFTFQADRGQMDQVLINLLKNAREASAPDTPIHVTLRRDMTPDQVLISVQDHGTGIPADVQQRIFVPFFTTKPDGSGIGLSLCKQIAYQHGGHLSIRSTPGKGSCFTLCLPRKGQKRQDSNGR